MFFFFSSRRRHTRLTCDWSSDVCSSDLGNASRGLHGPDTKVIDLRGRTVVPGIIDNHNHIVLMGNRPGFHTPLENALSIQDVQQIYAARAAGLPNRDAWITTIGGFLFLLLRAPPRSPVFPYTPLFRLG